MVEVDSGSADGAVDGSFSTVVAPSTGHSEIPLPGDAATGNRNPVPRVRKKNGHIKIGTLNIRCGQNGNLVARHASPWKPWVLT
jgi:hypothetical protein